jgi:hypothetical protein
MKATTSCAIGLAAVLVGGQPMAAGSAGPHPKAPRETAQFAFLIGEHHCTTQQMQPDGTYLDSGEAQWNGRYILDGWAIEDEWISPRPDGETFRGLNIRSFNPQTRTWDNRWLATGTLQWKYFSAEKVGDTMVMIGGEGEDARGAFVDRNTFSETGPEGFGWRKDRSWDGGESWIEGVARIDCRTRGSS